MVKNPELEMETFKKSLIQKNLLKTNPLTPKLKFLIKIKKIFKKIFIDNLKYHML